ncbi:MAG: DUF2007 domain-containing protein [Brevefilum sp.]|nr:DUF2007 domain-containing protein [Brevefilum sp.]
MKLINVYSAAGLLEADMLKAFLESQGIDVYLSQESVGRTLGLSAGTLGRVDVMVPEPQADEAMMLLTEMDDGEFSNYEYPEDMDGSDLAESDI